MAQNSFYDSPQIDQNLDQMRENEHQNVKNNARMKPSYHARSISLQDLSYGNILKINNRAHNFSSAVVADRAYQVVSKYISTQELEKKRNKLF